MLSRLSTALRPAAASFRAPLAAAPHRAAVVWTPTASFHGSPPRRGLEEFYDARHRTKAPEDGAAGRAWEACELRRKSFNDHHLCRRCPPSAASGRFLLPDSALRTRRFAGAEDCSGVPQADPNRRCERMRAAKHAPCGPNRLFERRHGLMEIIECGAFVLVERPRVISSHRERVQIILSENASCHGHRFAQQCLGLFQ